MNTKKLSIENAGQGDGVKHLHHNIVGFLIVLVETLVMIMSTFLAEVEV